MRRGFAWLQVDRATVEVQSAVDRATREGWHHDTLHNAVASALRGMGRNASTWCRAYVAGGYHYLRAGLYLEHLDTQKVGRFSHIIWTSDKRFPSRSGRAFMMYDGRPAMAERDLVDLVHGDLWAEHVFWKNGLPEPEPGDKILSPEMNETAQTG